MSCFWDEERQGFAIYWRCQEIAFVSTETLALAFMNKYGY